MLGAHSSIFTHPEPHLITPLAFLGYHDTVDAAPYDHINAAQAIRLFVDGLPGGEDDYFEALRAYAQTLYSRMLATSKKSYFLDKTPAYALIWRFLVRLFPHARYVVLTRHPLAIFSSYANSFYHGDWQEAERFNPVVERYIPAIAELLREKPVPLIHVGYEDLVRSPELELKRIFDFLGLDHEEGAIHYQRTEMKAGMGDPINVARRSQPTTSSIHKWAEELCANEAKRKMAETMIAKLSDADLTTWKWPRTKLWDALSHANGQKAPKPVLNRYTFQRRLMLALRKGVHARPEGERVVRKVRYVCDVLLRDTLNAR